MRPIKTWKLLIQSVPNFAHMFLKTREVLFASFLDFFSAVTHHNFVLTHENRIIFYSYTAGRYWSQKFKTIVIDWMTQYDVLFFKMQ